MTIADRDNKAFVSSCDEDELSDGWLKETGFGDCMFQGGTRCGTTGEFSGFVEDDVAFEFRTFQGKIRVGEEEGVAVVLGV